MIRGSLGLPLEVFRVCLRRRTTFHVWFRCSCGKPPKGSTPKKKPPRKLPYIPGWDQMVDEAKGIALDLGIVALSEQAAQLIDRFESRSVSQVQNLGGLTKREIEVLDRLAAGKSNREIARDLVLSVRTVERHITNIYGKIGARGRADATAFAIHNNLTSK